MDEQERIVEEVFKNMNNNKRKRSFGMTDQCLKRRKYDIIGPILRLSLSLSIGLSLGLSLGWN